MGHVDVVESPHVVLHVVHHAGPARGEAPHRVGVAISIHGGRIEGVSAGDAGGSRGHCRAPGGGGWTSAPRWAGREMHLAGERWMEVVVTAMMCSADPKAWTGPRERRLSAAE